MILFIIIVVRFLKLNQHFHSIRYGTFSHTSEVYSLIIFSNINICSIIEANRILQEIMTAVTCIAAKSGS